MQNSDLAAILRKVTFYLGLILFWELGYQVGVELLGIWKPYSFASPIMVLRTLARLLMDNSLGLAVVISLRRLILGYGISLVLGSLIGLAIVKFKYFGDNIRPLLLGLQTLPSICWLPFAILWFGLDESAIIFITAIGSTFSVAIAVEGGMGSVNPLYVKAALTMGANGRAMYKNVIIPAALPVMIGGIKQGWSFAWRALIAGEMLCASVGLGHLLMVGRDWADVSQVMALMLVIIALGLIVDKLVFARIKAHIGYKWGLEQKQDEG